MYKNILVPTDGSELSNKAVDHAIQLAKAVGASITAISVVVPFRVIPAEAGLVTAMPEQYRESIDALVTRDLEQVSARVKAGGVKCETLKVENTEPYVAIIEAAKNKKCDLIVMASHGRRGISALVLGSETIKVLTHSTIPVLICR